MIKIIGPRDPRDSTALNVTSCSKNWAVNLSPMILGPVNVPNRIQANRVENAWQYSKVYSQHVDANGDPNTAWKVWSEYGYRRNRGERYPAGRGVIPKYLFWNNQKLDYIQARFKVYIPIYAEAARQSGFYSRLEKEYKDNGSITIWDFDGYDYSGKTLTECANDPSRPLGHSFVLAMMLEGLA
jgi:hypothetical protein